MDWLLVQKEAVNNPNVSPNTSQSQSQSPNSGDKDARRHGVGMWQVLVEHGLLSHGNEQRMR